MRLSRPTRASAPTWLFGALVIVAGPLLLFHYGTYHWFHRDEWAFLSESAGGGDAWHRYLHDPFGGAHWVAGPRLIYQGLWHLVGMTAYKPYQLFVVALHLGLAVLIHGVMRRAGVRPWLALPAAGLFVIGGPGATTTVWAFQMSIVGSMTFGFAQLVLADHDGPIGRRDALGLACGLLAITFSGVGVTTTVAVVVATLVRRGWRAALVHGGPLALVYGTWAAVTGAQTSGGAGRPSLDVVWEWLWESALGTVLAVSGWSLTAWMLAAILLGGLVVLWIDRRSTPGASLRTRVAMPAGLAVAALFFATSTALGRAQAGTQLARSDRYLYIGAALLLPLLATSAEALTRRWRAVGPVVAVLLLLPVPSNLARIESRGIEAGIFGPDYMAKREYILRTVVRMPFADDVPTDVQPVPDPFAYGVDIGFLLGAVRDGKLTPTTMSLTPRMENEFRVRLGVAQRAAPTPTRGCQTFDEPVLIDPAKGDVIHLGSQAVVTTARDGKQSSPGVLLNPAANGSELTIELPDLHLRFKAFPGEPTFTLCGLPDR